MTTASFDSDRRSAGPELEPFLDALGRVTGKQPRRVGKEWRALCPVHGDTNESLNVAVGDRQPVVAICRSHACEWGDVLSALGFEAPRRAAVHRPTVTPAAPAKTKKAESQQLGKVVAEYRYVDAAGELLYTVTRFDPKDFRQKRPDPEKPGRWRWNLDGVRRVPYRLPELTAAIAAGSVVHLVEGEKDADTLAGLGLAATAHAQGAKNWRAEYAEFFAGAHVVVFPDNDGEGRAWADAACTDLVPVAASVRRVELPDLPPKGDVTDWLAGDRDIEDLERLVDEAPVLTRESADADAAHYEVDAAGMYVTLTGRQRTRLSNFSARIVEDAISDDGVEERTAVTLAVTLGGQTKNVVVSPVSDLANPAKWSMTAFGAAARTEVVRSAADHIRAAVQTLSPPVPRRHIYGHTGWRDVGGRRAYLHGGGALGPDGPVPAVQVDLPPALSPAELVPPADRMAAVTAVLGSLQLLELAPDTVTVPLLGAVWRSVLAPSDFGVWLTGGTGAGKSQLAALAQAHFGAGFTSSTLPGSWSSTGNALEELAFLSKDALLVIDDFAPTGNAADISQLHRTAERVIRAQGNGAGRARMSRDLKVLAPRPPRGTLLGTGEDVPRGQSLRGRLLICHLDRGALDWNALTPAQQRADGGLYAQALAGFVIYLAGRPELLDSHTKRVAARRAELRLAGAHSRTPTTVAELTVAWEALADYAVAIGALTAADRTALLARVGAALRTAAEAQAAEQAETDPAKRFVALVRAALSSGRAHLASPNGHEPDVPGAWGWQGGNPLDEGRAQGVRIGWVTRLGAYLEVTTVMAVAQDMARQLGEPLPVVGRTLTQRLFEAGLLASRDETRKTHHVRLTAQGTRQKVLHLALATLGGGDEGLALDGVAEPS
ncbi:DUF927 domain-containing protein [Trujillonella endophytica]|uniref:DUF927 domain-containing protein n=1 Tax=Trujillonella endophytica TaxID=673521 RepID=A0A1H8WPA1_9ACTN|nr:DUF927 domain-containing protein [Trujillella endophytica]SEP29534.1 protein of unknown function [Trujillella endophytica]